MKKTISFIILIMVILPYGSVFANPGYHSAIDTQHKLMVFLASPKHMISLGFLMLTIGLVTIYKRMRQARIILRIR